MPSVDLPLGTIDYRRFGPDSPDAPTALFVHGFLVNGTLWDPVAEQLASQGVASIVPDWPLGGHRTPIPAEVELTPTSVAQGIVDLLDALDLHDVVLVGNDTGGGLCQLALAGDHSRIAGLVLTNCDAFDAFPPAFFVPLFKAARYRPAVWFIAQNTRPRLLRHSPLAFGPLISRPRSAALTRGWVEPVLGDASIRRDVSRFARGIQRTELIDAADWLATFDKPTRVVWGMADRHFKVALARRLVAALPHAELVEVDGSATFVSIDQPDAVTAAVLQVASDARTRASNTG